MKKLTAGIFAGILTIVTVNAADAAIASKAYVEQQRDANKALIETNADKITELTSVVGATENDGLQKAVADLKTSVGSTDVAGQIANALGGLDATNAVTAGNYVTGVNSVDGKVEISTAAMDTTPTADSTKPVTSGGVKTAIDAIMDGEGSMGARLTAAESDIDVLQSATAGYSSANTVKSAMDTKADAADVYTKGVIGEGYSTTATVKAAIEDAKAAGTAATSALDAYKTTQGTKDNGQDTKITALENKVGNNNVADELAKKQNLLTNTNVTTTGTGDAVVSVTAADGKVTATLGGNFIPEFTTTGETGTYVLTANIDASGVTNYTWESIDRGTTTRDAEVPTETPDQGA